MNRELRLDQAMPSDLDYLWPAVHAAHLFADREAFADFQSREPWCVRLGPRGTAAIVERWRRGLDVLAIRGIWAGGRDLVPAILDLRELADAHGFSRLLSPLLSSDARGPYEKAGLQVCERLVAYRLAGAQAARLPADVPAGVTVRPAAPGDLPAIGEIDAACFEPFWAYDAARIALALESQVLLVAESPAGLIGYTLSTVERGSGTLGRIAVAPAHRGRGVGAALLGRSARALADRGAASVSLCTQQDNAAARSLYSRAGMREVPGKLVFLSGDVRQERERA